MDQSFIASLKARENVGLKGVGGRSIIGVIAEKDIVDPESEMHGVGGGVVEEERVIFFGSAPLLGEEIIGEGGLPGAGCNRQAVERFDDAPDNVWVFVIAWGWADVERGRGIEGVSLDKSLGDVTMPDLVAVLGRVSKEKTDGGGVRGGGEGVLFGWLDTLAVAAIDKTGFGTAEFVFVCEHGGVDVGVRRQGRDMLGDEGATMEESVYFGKFGLTPNGPSLVAHGFAAVGRLEAELRRREVRAGAGRETNIGGTSGADETGVQDESTRRAMGAG